MKTLCAVIGFGILITGWMVVPASAIESPLADVIQKTQAAYESTSDWKAEFKQTTTIEGFDTTIDSNGNLYIKKPGKLRWDYLKPNKNQIVVNHEKIWIYTPEQNQVIVSAFSQISDSQLPLHLLTGVGRLDKDFDVAWKNPSQPMANGIPTLALTPKAPGTGLTKLWLTLDPVRFYITELTLFEANGNQSHFWFGKIRTNTGLKDPLFIFQPPKGVVVVKFPSS